MTRKLTDEDQLDLFGMSGPEQESHSESSADSLPSPGQASIDSGRFRYHWPPGYWWVCQPDDPQQGIQIKSESPELALKKACRTSFKGYPSSSLQFRQLRVRHGGYDCSDCADGTDGTKSAHQGWPDDQENHAQ